MSLVFNEAALHFLLEDEAGPVGLDLRLHTESITRLYQDNIQNILPQFPEDGVGFEIFTGDLGLQAVIGIRDQGRWADYLGAKVEREPEKATNALAIGLDQK